MSKLNEHLTIRVERNLRAALFEAAAADRRLPTQLARLIIEDWLAERDRRADGDGRGAAA